MLAVPASAGASQQSAGLHATDALRRGPWRPDPALSVLPARRPIGAARRGFQFRAGPRACQPRHDGAARLTAKRDYRSGPMHDHDHQDKVTFNLMETSMKKMAR
jgi:hypothetical protein